MLDTLLNPDRRAEAVREQAALREKMGHKLDRHPAQIKFLYGLERERQVLAAVESIHAAGNNSPEATTLNDLFNRLAEGYDLQARYREASDVTQDAARQKEYEAKAQALESLGVKRCNCPPARNRPKPGNAKGENYPTSTPIEEVCDGKRLITLTRCSICQTISARLLK